jgi:DNA-binding MarR family transcriptional regulator
MSDIPLAPLLGQLKEAAMDELHRRLHDQGYEEIRPGHGCVFRFIDKEGTRLTELAERSGYTKQAVGEVVADLEALGYVRRMPDPADGRAKTIVLTPRGHEALAAGRQAFADIEQRWREEFGDERITQLRETVELLLEAERGALPA